MIEMIVRVGHAELVHVQSLLLLSCKPPGCSDYMRGSAAHVAASLTPLAVAYLHQARGGSCRRGPNHRRGCIQHARLERTRAINRVSTSACGVCVCVWGGAADVMQRRRQRRRARAPGRSTRSKRSTRAMRLNTRARVVLMVCLVTVSADGHRVSVSPRILGVTVEHFAGRMYQEGCGGSERICVEAAACVEVVQGDRVA